MKKYEEPALHIFAFSTSDVLTNSFVDPQSNADDMGTWNGDWFKTGNKGA